MDKAALAIEKHGKGYNCAQAVLSVFADEIGMDEVTAYKLMEGLGGGVGGLREVCGAFSAAAAVIGFYNSSGTLDGETKKDTYATVQNAAELFKEKYDSVICRKILEKYPAPCDEKIAHAVCVIEEIIDKKGDK
mgnify:CR=1 FL=1